MAVAIVAAAMVAMSVGRTRRFVNLRLQLILHYRNMLPVVRSMVVAVLSHGTGQEGEHNEEDCLQEQKTINSL